MRRTAEIGLRIALDAGHTQVRLQILREGATLAIGGLVLGLVGSYALGRTNAKHALRQRCTEFARGPSHWTISATSSSVAPPEIGLLDATLE